ncbi:MAG: leucine-rich repeat domain-containing protein, partial [Bacteroidales bacterium]|nr:leucine-rich repeat domain-containing protein [Bacteroidales bacterium]
QQYFGLNGFQYITIDNGSVAVWNCYNNQDTLIIPDVVTFNNVKYTVVEIAGGAFWGKDYIVSVIIPSTVTSIGESAFRECENLSSVVMPNSITNIGSAAFWGCPNLTSFTIPNSVTHIGAAIFGDCTNLTTLDYNARNCNGVSVGTNHPFSYSSISTINIGDDVEKIPENFLYDMDSITTINFSNNITHIGKKAFAYYDNFTTLNLPDSITHIGEEAFLECDNLSSITLTNNLTYIGIGAFKGCGSLNSITIPNNVTRIDDEAFEDCINLNSVDFLTNNLTYIGDGAFKNCTSLNTFVVPNSVDSLGKLYGYALYPGTFEGCSSLTKITLGKDLKYISEATFNNCTSLQTLVSLATIPPTFQYVYNTFANTNNVDLVVGCDALPNYQNSYDWSYYFANNMTEIVYQVNIYSNDENKGVVDMQRDCSTATITATANPCFKFYSWSDGNTEPYRIVSLDSDTTIVAIFDEIKTIIDATINEGEVYQEYGFCESEPGTYTQILTDENGCDSLLILNLTYQVSLNDVEEENNISFYPNPTSSEIIFTTNIEQIEVMDLTGKRLMIFNHEKQINIEALPSGIYYLRLINDKKVTTKKVIKQ